MLDAKKQVTSLQTCGFTLPKIRHDHLEKCDSSNVCKIFKIVDINNDEAKPVEIEDAANAGAG